MNKNEFAVGLDIGTTKIVAIVGKKNDQGKIEIMGVGRSISLGVHKGIVNNNSNTIIITRFVVRSESLLLTRDSLKFFSFSFCYINAYIWLYIFIFSTISSLFWFS